MSMLDLPNELFEPIIRHLVQGENGIIECAKYRLVCKAFAVSVANGIDERACRMRLFDFLGVQQHVKYFEVHGEHMLHERVMRGIDTSIAVRFIENTVKYVLLVAGPKAEAERSSILANLCRVMMAVPPSSLREIWHMNRNGQATTFSEMRPTIAAAMGNLITLRDVVEHINDILYSPYNYLPSPLAAATITGQKHVLQWQLDCIAQWVGIIQAHKEIIISVLKTAIRTQSNDTGRMLFGALEKLETLNPKLGTLGGSLYMCALKYDNVELVCKTLGLSDNDSGLPEFGFQHSHKLDKKKLGRLSGIGSSKMLARLIQEGWINILEDHNDRTLLSYALRCRRYDLAETVLEYGADINACSRGEGCTALWHAVRDGYDDDVLFLLKHGADLVPNKSGWRPQEFTTNKTVWLLRLCDNSKGRALLKKSNEEIYEEHEKVVKDNYAGFCF